jgi:hypothetical protein
MLPVMGNYMKTMRLAIVITIIVLYGLRASALLSNTIQPAVLTTHQNPYVHPAPKNSQNLNKH